MIDYHNKNLCVFPCFNCGISKEFSSSHNGTDWAYVTSPISWVMAIQDGIVREVGYSGWDSDIGYYVTLEHQYSDGTKRFTGYIHMYEQPIVKVGQEVKAGQQLGYRGGSPYNASGKAKFGVHLHLYTTKVLTNVNYSWNNMKNNVIDPFKELTFAKLKNETYVFAKEDGHNFGASAKYYDDLLYIDEHIGEIEALKKEIAVLTEKINKQAVDFSNDLKAVENDLNKERELHSQTKNALASASNKIQKVFEILEVK